MALFDYLGGAKKRKEQIDEILQEGTTQKPSLRAAQPKPKVKKKPFVAPPQPVHIRDADYSDWVAKRKAAYDAQ